jgi:PD-(D/E)XK nuclease superfamily
MTDTPQGHVPGLVDSLARVARRHRVARKLVVAPNFAAGRELLRRLALVGNAGWIGFEVTTPQRLAQGLALSGMEKEGLTLLDPFEHQALLDEALDFALRSERGTLGELAEGVGFREHVHGAIAALRAAGIGPREVDAAHFGQWDKKLFLLRVLQRYERLLAERHRGDVATTMRLALDALDSNGQRLPEALDTDVVLLLPGIGTRGLQGRLLSELGARGARLLETDPVLGIEVPKMLLWGRAGALSPGSYLYAPEDLDEREPRADVDFFRAASIDAELREVLRRIVERGLAWDQVEIITTDPAAYGSAMHALGRRLGIPVTYAVGLPIGRTRTGRVVQSYLDWIEEGFQAHVIRRLLEAGDLRAPKSRGRHAPAALARRFRGLRVGWGRKRYRAQIREALEGVDAMERRRSEPEESFERRRERARTELEALKSILFPALKQTPAVPDRMTEPGEPVSPAELARGLEAFLRRVPRGRGPDRSAREDVGRILERITGTLHRRTQFRSAVSILRQHLNVRVRPELFGDAPDGAGAPWSSMGGALHLSDLDHGGFSGREAVFLVGLDAERIPGGGNQDPVLLDSDRRVLGRDLPTAPELLKERIFKFAALFARLRGKVTMSYGSWQATEARVVGPSSVLLQALRVSTGDGGLTFADLRERMGRVVSAVPAAGRLALDADDFWMSALGSGPVMREGVASVRASYARLDAGLAAGEERREGPPGPIHGVIAPRPEELDPRLNEATIVSASRLEGLGVCPLRYLHGSVLRLRAPDDPELHPDAWLDPRQRGSLLHDVYDTTLREAQARGITADDRGFEDLAADALSRGVRTLRRDVPIPGEGTLVREIAALQEDVRSFVRMIREQHPEPIALELKFGLGDDEPVLLELEGGTLRLRGAIDRVDQDLSGLHVIDYKTGSTYGYDEVVFRGGRRLQHAIYAHAAEERLEGDVVDGQYHFPTRKGQNQTFSYARADLGGLHGLLETMLDGVAAGHFVPTDSKDDCKFCDFAEICRVRTGSFNSVSSPLAEWSNERTNLGLAPEFEQLKRLRTCEE